MSTTSNYLLCFALVAVGCGSGAGSNVGSGTQTLFVDGRVSAEGGDANVRIHIERAGVEVTDAKVMVGSSLLAPAAIAYADNGDYRQTLAGFGTFYSLDVSSGTDGISSVSITTPARPTLTSPLSIDAHASATIVLTWSGDHAQTVRVRSRDFDSDEIPDTGRLEVPATAFTEATQEVRIERENKTPIAGGVAGSELRSTIETRATLVVANPYLR